MKKFAGIAFVMSAVMLTACQNNVVNSDITAESTENTSGITQTSNTEQNGDDSKEESGTESLTKEEQRRNELFERASTVKRDDSEGAILKKMGDGYIVTGSGISRYLYEICPWEYFEVGNGLGDYLAYYNYKSEEVELNGNISRFPKEISDKLNQLNSESTLENVEELFGNPSESDNMLVYNFTAVEKGIEYFGEDNVWLYFGYTDKLKVYIPNSIVYVNRIGNHDYMEKNDSEE